MGEGYQLSFFPQAVFAPQTSWRPLRQAEERDLLAIWARRLLMKKLTLFGGLVLLATSISAQSPAANEQEEVVAMMKEVQAQQLQIADNQAKIDEKLATLAEAIRVARIYGSRGGR
jgi:hypothetical protein